MSEEKITFLASMPPIDSALRFSGAGNGARLQLDIPENQLEFAAWLLTMRQCRLRVTIEIVTDGRTQEQQTTERTLTAPKRTKAKKRD
jgi:hypothetical protein